MEGGREERKRVGAHLHPREIMAGDQQGRGPARERTRKAVDQQGKAEDQHGRGPARTSRAEDRQGRGPARPRQGKARQGRGPARQRTSKAKIQWLGWC